MNPKTAFERREVCYRKLKSIDIGKLREDIGNSPLADPVSVSGDLDDLICQYNTVLSELLDKHAPLKKRMITLRPAAPWYTDAIRTEKRKRRKLERRWRASGLTVHRELYVNQCKLVNKCIFDAKMGYYSALIEENDSDPKKLFSSFDKVLHRKAKRKFPHSDYVKSLVNAFADFFTTKISNIRKELQLKKMKKHRCPLANHTAAVRWPITLPLSAGQSHCRCPLANHTAAVRWPITLPLSAGQSHCRCLPWSGLGSRKVL